MQLMSIGCESVINANSDVFYVEAMVDNHADTLLVPLRAYPEFFVERKKLVQQLLDRGMAVCVVPLLAAKDG